jgi:hypothetical protein
MQIAEHVKRTMDPGVGQGRGHGKSLSISMPSETPIRQSIVLG